MKRLASALILAVSVAGCAGAPTATQEATVAPEVSVTESATIGVSATAAEAESTEEALPTMTALPVMAKVEAITPPPLNAAAFSPDGSRLAYVSTVGLTMLDAANDFAVLWTVELPGVESFGLAWSEDGARLVTLRVMERTGNQNDFTGVTKASVLTLDASHGAVVNEIPSDAVRIPFNSYGASNTMVSVSWRMPAALSKDGIWYAVPGTEIALGRSDMSAEQSLRFEMTLENSGVQHVMGMAFSPDGALFAAGGEIIKGQRPVGGTVQVWSLETMAVISRFEISQPGAVVFSPDGGRIAVLSGQVLGGWASGLHVIDLGTGETVWSQYGEFSTLAWSEHGIYTELEGRLVRYHPETGNRYEREGLVFPAYLSTTWVEASEYGVIRVTPEFVHLLDAEEMSSRVLASGFLPAAEAGLGMAPYGEVVTYSPDGSAAVLRSHSYVWVRFAESTYFKGIEGTGAVAWSPQSDRIAIGSGQEIVIWGVRGPALQRIESPIPVEQVMWLTDPQLGDVIVVAGKIGTYGEQVGGWDVNETGFAAIDVESGDVIWERAGFPMVRHVTASAESGRIVIEHQRGDQANAYLVVIDAATGETVSEVRFENVLNFPAILSPDGSRLIFRDHAQYSLFDEALGLVDRGGGAAPGAIQWAADSGSVMAMTGDGRYYIWDREMALICQKNARAGIDGLARAIHPAWSEAIFETADRVLEVWRLNWAAGCG